jgi:DUF1009 family protein
MKAKSPLGLIAGNGDFPVLIAQAAKREGKRVIVAGYKGEASRALAPLADQFFWVGLGELEMLVRRFKGEGVRDILLAGGVDKKKMFAPFRGDARGRSLWEGLSQRRDDFILRRFAEELEKEGFRVRPSTALLPSLLAPKGVLTRRGPTAEEEKDIAFGWPLAKAVGRLDIGQCLVVRDQAVLAVEAIEGTDETIRRGGRLARKDAVVIKVSKPGQDLRFDLPAVGEQTVQVMHEVKARVLAVEAGRTVIFNREATIRLADRYQITIVGR